MAAAIMDKKGKRALYVGGLDKQVTEQVLYAAFVPFGPLKSVQVPMDYSTRTLSWRRRCVIHGRDLLVVWQLVLS